MKDYLNSFFLGVLFFLPLSLEAQNATTVSSNQPLSAQDLQSQHIGSAIIDSMLVYKLLYPQEKVFLHLNMPYYSKRDDIFFKAYLTHARNHNHFTPSKIIYVDLIGPSGKVLDSLSLHTEKGMAGSFVLNDSMAAGNYQIRAYTQHMRNFSEEFFFHQTLEVIDPKESLFPSNRPQAINEQDQDKRPSVNMRFFPEGGEMVLGLQSKLAYEIKDDGGNALALEGVIVDQEGNELLEFKPSHKGMGVFSILPKPKKRYAARIRIEEKEFEFPIPEARSKGFVMECNNLPLDALFLKLNASEGMELNGAFVIGHVRGEVFGLYDKLKPGASVRIPKEDIPTGLAHFTLFDAAGKPQAERLVFNERGYHSNNLQHQFSKDAYGTREKVELEVDLGQRMHPATFQSLSLAVVDELMVPDFQEMQSIRNYLYLNSEIDEQIQKPNFYLEGESPQNRFFLDLILLTKGWRRFTWKEILGEKPSELPYYAEQGLNLEGFISKKYKAKARVPAQVMINSLSEEFYLAQLNTDGDGNFVFKDLPFKDSTTFLLQASMLKGGKKNQNADEISIDGNRWVDFHMKPVEKPKLLPKQTGTIGLQDVQRASFLRNAAKIDSVETLIDNAKKLVELDSVEITAYQRERFRLGGNTFWLDGQDWIHPETSALELMQSLKPRSRLSNNYGTGTLRNTYRAMSAEAEVTVNMKIFIDGMESNSSRLLGLKADYIRMITITNTVVFVVTRAEGARSSPNSPKPGSYLYFHNGYHAAREFYAPDYSQKDPRHDLPDLRSAIHWDPNIKLDKQGKAKISFYAADLPTQYAFRLQGMIGNKPISKEFSLKIE